MAMGGIMEKKSRKKLWIVLLAVLLIVLVLLVVGYFAVNKAFSVVTDSFYKSSESIVQPSSAPEGADAAGTADGNEPTEEDSRSNTENTQGDVGSAISSAAERYGISTDVFKLSSAEIKELEKKVSFADKVAVLNILSSGLSAAEYKELVGMLNDGVSRSDMQRAYQILSKSLSHEDKEKIAQYYQKYAGLLK